MEPRTIVTILRASIQPTGASWRKQSLTKFGRTEEDPPPATVAAHPSHYLHDGRRFELWFETCKIDVTEPPSASNESDANKRPPDYRLIIQPNGVICDQVPRTPHN